MKILDKYVAKNFLIGCAISLCMLVGLRIVIDAFVNLDEFTENTNIGVLAVITNIFTYYAIQSTLYFRDFAGMIPVVAAAFSLGKMVKYNELTAMMASGVSLKRIVAPIVVLAIAITGILIIDQELIIPSVSSQLVRSKKVLPGQESYSVWFISDASGSLLCAKKFDTKSSTLQEPIILTRARKPDSIVWEPTGWIEAETAKYDFKNHNWILNKGTFTPVPKPGSLALRR